MKWFLCVVIVPVLTLIKVSICQVQPAYSNWKEILKLARERCNNTCFKLGLQSENCKKCRRNLQDCDPLSGTGPYLGEVENVKVHFSGKSATVSWSAINLTGVEAADNFTGYYVMWLTSKIVGNVHTGLNFSGTCKEIDKSEPCNTVVKSTRDWVSPDSLFVFVTTAPLPRLNKFTLLEHPAPYQGTEYISGLPTPSPPTKLAAWIAGGVTGGVALVGVFAVLIYCRRRKEVQHQTDSFHHDLFISYSRQDGEFLTQTLLPLLARHSIKYCIDYKDWIPGRPWHENLVQCICNSRKVLILASSSSVSSDNCKAELEQALYWASSNIIILRIDSFSIDLLPRSVASKTFIDYADSVLERRTWQTRLIKVLKSSTKERNEFSRQHLCEVSNNNYSRST